MGPIFDTIEKTVRLTVVARILRERRTRMHAGPTKQSHRREFGTVFQGISVLFYDLAGISLKNRVYGEQVTDRDLDIVKAKQRLGKLVWIEFC